MEHFVQVLSFVLLSVVVLRYICLTLLSGPHRGSGSHCDTGVEHIPC